MLNIGVDGTIQLTRGDTARLSVAIRNDSNDTDYVMAETDILKLTVKKTVNDTTPCFQKSITGSTQFHIQPSDTKQMAFGKYIYDVELSTEAGEVYTVIAPSIFEIMKEVT